MDPSAAVGPVTDIVKCAVVPAARHLGYIFCYKKNVADLKSKVDNYLVPLEADVKTNVELALKKGEEVYQTVKKWMEKVDTAKAEASKFHEDALQLTGWSSQSYRLGKEAKKIIVGVGEILTEGREILNKPISFYGPYKSVPVEGFDGFESRKMVKHRILEALKNDQVVGVYGMGGIGKTILMKQILEQAKNEQLFKEVVMATVSQPPRLIKIQSEIAEQLGMDLKETTIHIRAARICARLTQCTSLVLLDDLWKELNLLEVGIPIGETSHGCKVVITTRSSEVCNRMDVQTCIEVKVLSEEDSWALFQRNAGDYVNGGVSEKIANEVVDECKGLPLAIVTLARSLRHKNSDVWIDAAKQLKRSRFADMSPVFTSIKYSYDNLETKERKLCFLFFCLYPEDDKIKIEDLFRYAVGDDIFRDAETLSDVRSRLYSEVDKLISSSLLLKGKDDSYIMVHDIVRDVGISIASEESNGFLIKAGMEITQWPALKTMRTCLRMSLMKNNISELKDTPACPQLSVLSLADNESLTSISNGFLKGMQKLVILDLSGTGFSSLPQSISYPVNYLRTLLLNKCRNLKDISGIGSLTQLEILDLSGCDLRRLSEEMKSLTKLKLLNLSYNENLAVIPLNVISSLTFLEEFYMFDSFSHWNLEGEANLGNASFSELLSLPWLSTLHIGTNQDSLVYMDYQFKLMKLSRLKIILHSSFDVNDYFGHYSNILVIKANEHRPVGEWVKALWEVSDQLILQDSGTMEGIFIDGDASLSKLKALLVDDSSVINLPSELMVSLQNLKSIMIWNCNNLKAINSEGDVRQLMVMCNNLETIEIDECINMEVLFDFRVLQEEGLSYANILSNLREISLNGLPDLEKIWKGSVSFESIQNLKKVHVDSCHKLNYLFPISMAQNLQRLEILEIRNCDNMVQIFGWKEEEVNEISSGPQSSRITAVLPQLKTLFIKKTKLLKLSISFSSLENLTIKNCYRLKEVFNSASLLFPLLTYIKLEGLPKLTAIWKGFIPIGRFRNLKQVDIGLCKSLSYLFPISVAQSLQQLEILKIKNCDEMVHIFGSDEEEKEEREIEKTVNEIVDTSCCILEKFWNRRRRRGQEPSAIRDVKPPIIMKEFSRLEEVFNSEGLKEDDSATLQSSSAKILLYRLPKLTAIWKGFIPVRSFQNLKEIEIYECKSLNYIFPISAVMSLQQLEVLQIGYCNEMVHIFDSDEEEKEERETEETVDEIVDTKCCMIEKFGMSKRRDQEPSAIGDINDGQPPIIKAMLPRLKILLLKSLIKLSGFCQQSSIIFFYHSLEKLHIENCPNLKRLPLDPNSTPELKEFEASNYWFYRLQWDDQSTQARLQSVAKMYGSFGVWCNYCKKGISKEICVNCLECSDFDLCIECFSVGAEILSHKSNHSYRVVDNLSGPFITPDWSVDEEALLLEGVKLHGLVNWAEVAKDVGTKSIIECIDHYPAATLKMRQSVDPPLARPHK